MLLRRVCHIEKLSITVETGIDTSKEQYDGFFFDRMNQLYHFIFESCPLLTDFTLNGTIYPYQPGSLNLSLPVKSRWKSFVLISGAANIIHLIFLTLLKEKKRVGLGIMVEKVKNMNSMVHQTSRFTSTCYGRKNQQLTFP